MHLTSFVCPISREVMRDPVVAGDGHSYERSEILRWFQQRLTSPVTNQPVASAAVVPNHTLKQAIQEACSGRGTVSNSLRRPSETLPEDGYFVYQLLEPIHLCLQPRIPAHTERAMLPNGAPQILPPGQLVVVNRREYGADNVIFLRLLGFGSGEPRYVYEARHGVVMATRVDVARGVQVYKVLQPTRVSAQPTASTVGDVLAVGTVVSTDLVVRPASGPAFARLERTTKWVRLAQLQQLPLTTGRYILKLDATTKVSTNALARVGGIVETMEARAVVACQSYAIDDARNTVHVRVAKGWFSVPRSDLYTSRPPRLATEPAGQKALLVLQGEYYLLVLNEAQWDGSFTQRIVRHLPDDMDRQIDNCIAKGRHVTHAALGPKDEWYISGSKPDGSGAHCWSKRTSAFFQSQMAPNATVAFGEHGAFLMAFPGGAAASDKVPDTFHAQLCRGHRLISLGFRPQRYSVDGIFVLTSAGLTHRGMPDWLVEQVELGAVRGSGKLCGVVLAQDYWALLREHNFESDAPTAVEKALRAFYDRHRNMQAARARLLSYYDRVARGADYVYIGPVSAPADTSDDDDRSEPPSSPDGRSEPPSSPDSRSEPPSSPDGRSEPRSSSDESSRSSSPRSPLYRRRRLY
ncbi:hypothetical protein SPRG_03351 [Saprolegnia parasitica CBS 223.65]|uniref:U-box domain-containing protein n=1 Tax=Saprolegnia parasitica (strain CBS 223.65) TaxID=695850 RepID=A0A067CN63_SAPPC|nr:hypothetical protein SPRG_03351 [Saprolegnia parasitica CBS 223.65]KDO32134.1 hypothetical protein SPRG_03351 [Saprolegnia parasitica CBS 223.65]|eukprot:XP_012197318.1 hypothetical protein SPRG_03351 [Saprolegnia parasitica CBS 223.65]